MKNTALYALALTLTLAGTAFFLISGSTAKVDAHFYYITALVFLFLFFLAGINALGAAIRANK